MDLNSDPAFNTDQYPDFFFICEFYTSVKMLLFFFCTGKTKSIYNTMGKKFPAFMEFIIIDRINTLLLCKGVSNSTVFTSNSSFKIFPKKIIKIVNDHINQVELPIQMLNYLSYTCT
jgi:hypothetical protein